jgi:hypothetical protein
MGIKVWAFRTGNFVQDSSSGWRYSIPFNSLDGLIKELRDKKLMSQVETLAIIAHGDTGGLVQLDRDLTAKTIGSFGRALIDLNDFLIPFGKLIFVSCIAALGEAGDDLLNGISQFMPNRHIIGFTINGATAQEGLPSVPGQVLEGENIIRGMPAKLLKGLPALTEYSYFSKWALNGHITKIPIQEQIKKPNYKCAWGLCPGHAKPTDRCEPAIKGLGGRRPYPG